MSPEEETYGFAQEPKPSEPEPAPPTDNSATGADADDAAEEIAPIESDVLPPFEEPKSPVPDPPEKGPVEVLPTWNRFMEWRASGAVVAICLLASLLIVRYPWWVAGAVLIAGLGYAAYWISITLEVPVRVTPEQSAREYYAALNHRFPCYQRMFHLLSNKGRKSDAYRDFVSFKQYWQNRLAQLSSRPIYLQPLEFSIVGFEHSYSSDRNGCGAAYRVEVRQGKKSGDPIVSIVVKNTMVKAQDGMWYLQDGRLPQ